MTRLINDKNDASIEGELINVAKKSTMHRETYKVAGASLSLYDSVQNGAREDLFKT